MFYKPEDERMTPSLKLDGEEKDRYFIQSEAEKTLAFIKFNQEMEGLEVTPEMEELGRKLCAGEINLNEILEETKNKYSK